MIIDYLLVALIFTIGYSILITMIMIIDAKRDRGTIKSLVRRLAAQSLEVREESIHNL